MSNSDNLSPAPTPKYLVGSVTLTPATASLALNGTSQLTATAKDGLGGAGNTVGGISFKYESSSPVATVDGNGLVTAFAGTKPSGDISKDTTHTAVQHGSSNPQLVGGIAVIRATALRLDGNKPDGTTRTALTAAFAETVITVLGN